jgi:hypothetical protein
LVQTFLIRRILSRANKAADVPQDADHPPAQCGSENELYDEYDRLIGEAQLREIVVLVPVDGSGTTLLKTGRLSA